MDNHLPETDTVQVTEKAFNFYISDLRNRHRDFCQYKDAHRPLFTVNTEIQVAEEIKASVLRMLKNIQRERGSNGEV